jgi:hypothetical protein
MDKRKIVVIDELSNTIKPVKRFDVISIMYDTKCSMSPSCKGCYAKAKIPSFKKYKSYKWFYALPKYLSQITSQVAIAGLEPFETIDFVKRFSKECHKYGLICNLTTNGKHVLKMQDRTIKSMLKHVTMVSVSYDSNKIRNENEHSQFNDVLRKLDKFNVNVAVNYLLNKNGRTDLLYPMLWGLSRKIQINILHPKPITQHSITKQIPYFRQLNKQPNVYFDDCIRNIYWQGYKDWKLSCHAGKNVCSMMPDGSVCGCSFVEPEIYLDKPSDVLKLKTFKFKERRCHEDVK